MASIPPRNDNHLRGVEQAEAMRQEAEAERLEAEEERAVREEERQSAETLRGIAEGLRQFGEQMREAAESNRVAAEVGRQSAEAARAEAEAARQAAELARQAADLARSEREQVEGLVHEETEERRRLIESWRILRRQFEDLRQRLGQTRSGHDTEDSPADAPLVLPSKACTRTSSQDQPT